MEIAFEPYKKVSFQSYLMYESSEAFANVIATANPPGIPIQKRLFWANGVLFRFFSHPPTEAVTKEAINGRLIWDHIEFAPMPEYMSQLQVADRPLVIMKVLDVSNHIVFGPLAEWIRKNLIDKKSR